MTNKVFGENKLRVGIYCPTLNVFGGGELVGVSIANTLALHDYDVILFTYNKVNKQEIMKFFGKSLDSSISIITKPSNVKTKGVLDFYQTIFLSYVFKSKCDLWIDVYSCRVFPWTQISYIHFPFLNHFFYRRHFPYIKDHHILPICGLPYVLFEKNFPKCDKKLLLANSYYTAEEIRKFSGRKAFVLYPPVPSIFFNSLETLNKARRKDLVITVSRFGPDKELEKIPYIASLTDKHIKYVVMGRMHHKETFFSLQKIIKKLDLEKRVILLPDISMLKMKQILRNAKIYLHPKVGEHFGISIAVAMASGCIPIVHDSGGPREFVPQNLRYRNIDEAAAKISKNINDWSFDESMKIAKIAEKFKEEEFSKNFMRYFIQYVNEKN
jgi:glycosyltransferase involved in cell wall biosynthesis